MKPFALANPGIVTTYEVGRSQANETFTIDLIGPHRILHTSEFGQDGIELEELTSSRPVSWGVPVPEDALVFGATSGITTGFSQQFWVGWLAGRRLHMQALMQTKPIDTELALGEVPIFPAVTDGSGVGSLYTWRTVRDGTALWRHSFAGQIKTVGSAIDEGLYEMPGHPVASVAGTIPGEQSQHAVIGWVEAAGEGSVLGIAVVLPERIRVIRSEPIPGMIPFVRQRLGIWAAAPSSVGRFQLIVALQSLTDQPTYSTGVLDIGPDSDHGSLALSGIGVPAGTLHAAAFDEEKNHLEPTFSRTFLTNDGTLWAREPVQVKRHSVDLDSPLPVASTSVYTYWGTRAADGTMTFQPL